MAKQVSDQTLTMCGTPYAFAPELIRACRPNAGYMCEVDWWALGVLLLVMWKGRPPFMGQGPEL